MEEKLYRWLSKMQMAELEFYLDRHGDTDETRLIFYQTFLNQSDKKMFQYEREKKFNIQVSLSLEEYHELEELRKYCVEQIRILELKEIMNES